MTILVMHFLIYSSFYSTHLSGHPYFFAFKNRRFHLTAPISKRSFCFSSRKTWPFEKTSGALCVSDRLSGMGMGFQKKRISRVACWKFLPTEKHFFFGTNFFGWTSFIMVSTVPKKRRCNLHALKINFDGSGTCAFRDFSSFR